MLNRAAQPTSACCLRCDKTGQTRRASEDAIGNGGLCACDRMVCNVSIVEFRRSSTQMLLLLVSSLSVGFNTVQYCSRDQATRQTV